MKLRVYGEIKNNTENKEAIEEEKMHNSSFLKITKQICVILLIAMGILYSLLTKQIQWSQFVLIAFVLLVMTATDLNIGVKQNFLTDKKQSVCIRGLMAVLIVLSHSHYYMDSLGFLKVFKPFGYLGVSVFFFLSGYGVVISSKNNSQYLLGYWKKRLLKLYVPYIFVSIIYLLCIYPVNMTGKEVPDIFSILFAFTAIKNLLPFAWYVIVILGWYVVYYIVAKMHLSYKKMLVILMSIVVLYYIIGIVSGIGSFFYNSSICLIIGSAFGFYEEAISRILNKTYFLVIFSVMFAASVVVLQRYGAVNNHIYSAIIICSSTLFILTLYTLGKYFSFCSTVLYGIGKISYEIYLLQGPVYILCKYFLQDNMCIFVAVFWSLLFLMAIAVNKISSEINGKFI
jgi:peptidoglycan/LPS O-acetylase OafA/YrhL